MKINSLQILPLFTAIIIFLFCDPYFMWGAYQSKYFYHFLKLVLFVIFLTKLDVKTLDRKVLFFLFCAIVVIIPLSHKNNINGFIVTCSVCTIPFANIKFSNVTYNYFLSLYSILISISGLIWVLHFVDVVPALGSLPPLNEFKEYNYILYPMLIVENIPNARFSGFFDEPGVVGTINALLLSIGKFNLKDKRLLMIFITGLFSLSLYFYIIVVAYYIFASMFNAKNLKFVFATILLLTIAIIISYNNSFINEMIWSRFEWDDTKGSFAGDNRLTVSALASFDSIIGTREFYFGVKDFSYYEETFVKYVSILMPIIQYGIVFVCAYILIFIRLGWIHKSDFRSYLFFVFLFLGTIFQRPFLFEPEYLFFFSLMAMNCGKGNIRLVNNCQVKLKREIL